MPDNTHKKTSTIIVAESATINIGPFAMAAFSSDLDTAQKALDSTSKSFATKYFLICLSVELAIKSSLLKNGVPRDEFFGHNLTKLLDDFDKYVKLKSLNSSDKTAIRKMDRFYDKEGQIKKGLVYFESNMLKQAVTRAKDFPEIKQLEQAHNKLQEHLRKNKYFIE